jgi:hypothetical protein
MPPENLCHRLLEHGDVYRTRESTSKGYVVGGPAGLKLVDEPQSLLSE